MERVLILLLALISCNPVYELKNCPNSPFPEANDFLSQNTMKDLKYNLIRDANFRIYQIWANEKIDFRVGLYYIFYGKVNELINETESCCKGITLTMPYPLSDLDLVRGKDFLRLYGGFLKKDFSDEIKALEMSRSNNSQSIIEYKEIEGKNLVFEISIEHSWNRGDKLYIGFYAKDYYNKFLAATKK